MQPTTREQEHTTRTEILYIALELGSTTWLTVSATSPQKLRSKAVPAGDLDELQREIERSKKRFGLSPHAQVKCCYEAGRDGFWIHRALTQRGIENIVVDSASIEVSRRKRRVKTDRVDGKKLVQQLYRHQHGEKGALHVIRVPSEEDEDLRRMHRSRERLLKERTSVVNRIRGQLIQQNIRRKSLNGLTAELDTLCAWNGEPLPPQLKAALRRDLERLAIVGAQVKQLEAEQCAMLAAPKTAPVQKARMLHSLRAIGWRSAWLLVMEFFGWRSFRNRRQVGAMAGLTGTPHASDAGGHDQGISKAGNPRVRTLMVELAWLWLRYQPQSDLSKWFHERWSAGGKRSRRAGIVALARKLLIDLWRFVDQGVVPNGALLRTDP
jgi:transposase